VSRHPSTEGLGKENLPPGIARHAKQGLVRIEVAWPLVVVDDPAQLA
jgi:hypothetical protein